MTGWWGLVPLEVPVDIGADEARRRALEELAKGKYAGIPVWVQEVALRLLDLIGRLVEAVLRPLLTGGRGGFSWTLLIVVVVLVALIALVVWKVGLPRWNVRRKDAAVGTDATAAPQTYRDAAERAAAAGDWPAAIRERFRSTVRALEELTVLDVRPARTAWEVARLAGRQVPTARPALEGAARTFNDVEYGDVPATEDGYRRMTAWDGEIVTAAEKADLTEAEPPGSAGSAGSAAPASGRRG